MNNLTKFGERITEFITEDGKNATTFAKALNINPTSVSEYMRGLHYPSTEIFYKLINYFNCSADYLLGLVDDYSQDTVYKDIPPFNERFRKVLEFCHFTQYRLETKFNFSGDIVYKWLAGKSIPTVENLIKLANIMECSVDFLIGRVN